MDARIRARHLCREAERLVKALKVHPNTAKAEKLVGRASDRALRRFVALTRTKYPSYRVVIPA